MVEDYGIDPALLVEFVDESKDLLTNATNLFITLEKDPENRDAIDTIFRVVHTIKGNSSFFNLMKVKLIAHRMEDLMNLVREGRAFFSKSVADVMVGSIDCLQSMLKRVRAGSAEVESEAAFNSRIQLIVDAIAHAKQEDVRALWRETINDIAVFSRSFRSDDLKVSNLLKKIIFNVTMLSPVKDKGEIDHLSSGGLDGMKSPLSADVSKVSSPAPASPGVSLAHPGKTMRISEAMIDKFLDYVGELVVVGEIYDHVFNGFSAELAAINSVRMLKKNNERFSQVSEALQKSLLDIRKVPVRNLIQRAPQIVREIASAGGKNITFFAKGDELLIDKSILESLEGPLVHILRNAADHGIESPEVRQKSGKPLEGRVDIFVTEDEESMTIAVQDDGGGIDHEAIKAKAIERGLLDKEAAKNLSARDSYQYMFVPGFSTAKVVTDVSGRGVGLDVVKKIVDGLGWKLTIDSEPGKGTTFTIQFPKSVIVKIMRGFLVGVGEERYVIPMSMIGESFQVELNSVIKMIDGGECINHKNKVYKFLRLSSVLGVLDKADAQGSGIGIIVKLENTELMLLVDAVLGAQQVVVNEIDLVNTYSKIVQGGAILGDGRVAIVLNLEKLST